MQSFHHFKCNFVVKNSDVESSFIGCIFRSSPWRTIVLVGSINFGNRWFTSFVRERNKPNAVRFAVLPSFEILCEFRMPFILIFVNSLLRKLKNWCKSFTAGREGVLEAIVIYILDVWTLENVILWIILWFIHVLASVNFP